VPGAASSAVADFGLVGVPPIAAGAMVTVAKGVSISGNTSVGLYYVLAHADDPGSIFEPNEANNFGASLTRLIVGPDVLPTAASTVTGAAPGTNVSVTYALKNQGGQAANLDVLFALEEPGEGARAWALSRPGSNQMGDRPSLLFGSGGAGGYFGGAVI
jgi:hypothetical protein